MLLCDIPEIAAHHEPDKVALWFEGRSWTFKELRDRCWKLSNALLGVASHGDRIAILSENCLEYGECYYGVPGAGMCLTFLNYRLTPRELTYIINNNTPSTIIVQQKYLETIRKIRPELTSVKTVIVIGGEAQDAISYDALIARGEAKKPNVAIAEDDLCWLLYTSGTTGLPKGAMLSHRNLIASIANSMASGAEALPDEIPLFMFPQFHVAGYVLPMYHLRCWTVVLLGAFDATSFLEAVQRYRVTVRADGADHVGHDAGESHAARLRPLQPARLRLWRIVHAARSVAPRLQDLSRRELRNRLRHDRTRGQCDGAQQAGSCAGGEGRPRHHRFGWQADAAFTRARFAGRQQPTRRRTCPAKSSSRATRC